MADNASARNPSSPIARAVSNACLNQGSGSMGANRASALDRSPSFHAARAVINVSRRVCCRLDLDSVGISWVSWVTRLYSETLVFDRSCYIQRLVLPVVRTNEELGVCPRIRVRNPQVLASKQLASFEPN